MSSATFEGLKHGKEYVELAFVDGGISVKSPSRTHIIEKDSIKNFSIFPSKKDFCFRVIAENAVSDFIGVRESVSRSIRDVVAKEYGVQIPHTELERLDTTRGNLVFTNSILSLHNSKEVFGIPKAEIRQVIELENDLEVHIDGADFVFETGSNVTQFLGNKAANETCVINNVSCISPRSRSTLVFFSDYFVMKGSSYDHSIFYSNICEMFLLPLDANLYFVVRLDNCIMQGQTKYDSLILMLQEEREIEVSTRGDGRLKEYYSGDISAILPEIVSKLADLDIKRANLSFKCTSKIHEGQIYLLDDSIQFLPKSINIPLGEISYVEFSRVNISIAQAKTFDMAIVSSKVHSFNGIQKSAYPDLEAYFSAKGIKIVSEVVEEVISSESRTEDDEESNLSDIVESDVDEENDD